MKKPAVVLHTVPAIGHLSPMLKLSKLVAARLPSVSVHVFIAAPPVGASSGVPSISSLSSSIPRVAFHLLPTPPLPLDVSASSTSFEVLVFKSLQLSNPDLLLSLKFISETHSAYAIVADFFCGCASPVARKLDIPFYFFFPTGGIGLALFLHFPILNAGCESSGRVSSLSVPTMGEVMRMLEGSIEVETPPMPQTVLELVEEGLDQVYREMLREVGQSSTYTFSTNRPSSYATCSYSTMSPR